MALTTLPDSLLAIEQSVHKRFPKATIAIDAPTHPQGSWFLDIQLQKHIVTVEWKHGHDFGITTNPGRRGYGEGVDEIHADWNSAYRRIATLLLGKVNTTPPEFVRLRELRALRGLSQMELAESLHVRQAAVSKLERRKDILLSTLKSVITAMGGELNVTANFPDGVKRQIQIEDHIKIPSIVSKPLVSKKNASRS